MYVLDLCENLKYLLFLVEDEGQNQRFNKGAAEFANFISQERTVYSY